MLDAVEAHMRATRGLHTGLVCIAVLLSAIQRECIATTTPRFERNTVRKGDGRTEGRNRVKILVEKTISEEAESE